MMNWTGYITLASVATIKFMFSAIPGPALGLSFLETVGSIFTGGVISASFFYFSGEFFMKRANDKRLKLKQEALAKGEFLDIKIFSRMNKGIVKLKLRFGKIGICFWAPFLLSVPIGSIVVAKFYGKYSYTFFYVMIGMLINSFLTSFIVYVFV